MENEQKDFKTTLLEMSADMDKRLTELYTNNREPIDTFFQTLTEDGVLANTELKITANDIANIHKTIEVLNKNVDSLQELAVMTSIQSKMLQQFLYNVAATNTLQVELKTE